MSTIRSSSFLTLIRALLVGAVFYTLYKSKSTYELLKQCVDLAHDSGEISRCTGFPESIDTYLYMLATSSLATGIVSHLLDKTTRKN